MSRQRHTLVVGDSCPSCDGRPAHRSQSLNPLTHFCGGVMIHLAGQGCY